MTERLARYKKGHRAENYAAWFLRLKGYRVLAKRHKTHVGEIDLIAIKGNCIIFCEVKARNDLSGGLEAIAHKAQLRIQRAAASFVQKNKPYENYDWRFDAVVVRPWQLPYHLKDAWRP